MAPNKVKITDHFIALYEQHRCLWDSSCKSYCNKLARQQALRNMCVGLNLPVDETTERMLKLKIKTIRSTFAKMLRIEIEQNETGVDNLIVPEWKWYQSLTFLRPHVSVRKHRHRMRDVNCEGLQETDGMVTYTQNSKDKFQYIGLIDPTGTQSQEEYVLTDPTRTPKLMSEDTSDPNIQSDDAVDPNVQDLLMSVRASAAYSHPVCSNSGISSQSGASTPGHCPATQPTPSASPSQSPTTTEPATSFCKTTCAPKSQHYHYAMDLMQRLDKMSPKSAFLARREIDNIMYQYTFE